MSAEGNGIEAVEIGRFLQIVPLSFELMGPFQGGLGKGRLQGGRHDFDLRPRAPPRDLPSGLGDCRLELLRDRFDPLPLLELFGDRAHAAGIDLLDRVAGFGLHLAEPGPFHLAGVRLPTADRRVLLDELPQDGQPLLERSPRQRQEAMLVEQLFHRLLQGIRLVERLGHLHQQRLDGRQVVEADHRVPILAAGEIEGGNGLQQVGFGFGELNCLGTQVAIQKFAAPPQPLIGLTTRLGILTRSLAHRLRHLCLVGVEVETDFINDAAQIGHIFLA